jgi:hypothetical protein
MWKEVTLSVVSVPVFDKGLELLRDHAAYELASLNADILKAQSLSDLLIAVEMCVPRLEMIPSVQSVAITQSKCNIQREIDRRRASNV